MGRDTPNTGKLVVKVEHRHKLGTDVAPAGLGSQIGYVGVTGVLFSDAKGILNDLNWQQRVGGGHSGFIVGRYDPNDYMDIVGYANPWTTFANLQVLLNASIALPDTSWGVGGGTWMNDQWFVLGSLNDANGTLTNTRFFKDGKELFTQVGGGWARSKDERYTHASEFTLWHVDKRDNAGVPESRGLTWGGNWMFGKEWMIFGRAGLSDGDAPIFNETITGGFGYLVKSRSDVLGVAFNWGDPAISGLSDQKTSEVFYRFQLAQNLALTPSMQFLTNPALNPSENKIWIFGLRGRLTL